MCVHVCVCPPNEQDGRMWLRGRGNRGNRFHTTWMNKMVMKEYDPNVVTLMVKMVSLGYVAKQTKATADARI